FPRRRDKRLTLGTNSPVCPRSVELFSGRHRGRRYRPNDRQGRHEVRAMLQPCRPDAIAMPNDIDITVFDAIRALAFIGDLSMGQPTDHSLRTAWLAGTIAAAAGCEMRQVEAARHVALLRWSGCTANAQEFTDFLDD